MEKRLEFVTTVPDEFYEFNTNDFRRADYFLCEEGNDDLDVYIENDGDVRLEIECKYGYGTELFWVPLSKLLPALKRAEAWLECKRRLNEVEENYGSLP